MRDVDQIQEQAALWVVREDRGLREDERAQFEAWLDVSTANRVAYIQLKDAWERADRLAVLRRPEPMRAPAQYEGRIFRRYAAAAVLAAFLCGAGGYYYFSDRTPRETYATGIGQQQTVRLSDGTTIQLNTNSRIQTQVTASSRTMRLEKGEVFFEVMHDARRPFVVLAGNRRITDLGTKFSVRLDGDQVRVLVTEGRVRVEVLGSGAPTAPTMADAAHVVIAQAAETLVTDRAPHEADKALSWRQGILVFDQDTLATAAEEFNRYNRKKIIVLGQARALHIGGRFRANNADIFASLIQNGLGLDVKSSDDEIIISK